MAIYLIGLVLLIGCLIPPFIFKKKNIWIIICLCVASLFMWGLCTFKSLNIGNDTIKYYTSYLSASDPSSIQSARDIGFGVFRFVCANIRLPWIIFLGLCNLPLFFGAAFFAYKRTPFPTLIVFFVYTFLLFEFALSGLRQSMSVGFLLIGMTFFRKEKWYTWLMYFLFNALAITMHKSCAVMLIYPFLSLIVLSKVSVLFFSMILITLAIFASQIESFAFYLISYLEYYPNNASSNYTLIFIIILVLLIIIFDVFLPKTSLKINDYFDKIYIKVFKKNIDNDEEKTIKNNLLFKTSFFQTLPLYIFLIVGLFSNTSVRGYYYSVVSFAACISYFIWSQKSKLFRTFLIFAFVMMFSLYFCVSFLRRSNCVPYEFFF